ncbi:hypothetical protein CMV_027844 [Castanea mollissima]|uniref:Uncharacterized protein n=1 Tax=Castanea mollissima TaxID=60419 RepID=A0A8J4QEP3_9ROSI|nr:hypothetical protein CMV_027844 [Castanea mollissima]
MGVTAATDRMVCYWGHEISGAAPTWDMWAAAYGFWRHSGVGHSFKAKPVHVSYYISTRICDVQEQAPEDERFGQGIPPRSYRT